MVCNTAVTAAQLAVLDVCVLPVSCLSLVSICSSTIHTLPNSSDERVPNGPTDSLAGRWALMMIRTFDFCKETGWLNHSLLYAASPTLPLCKHRVCYACRYTWCVQVLRSPKEAFAAAMQSWRERCEKCVCLQGDYIEKLLHFQLPVVSSFFKIN